MQSTITNERKTGTYWRSTVLGVATALVTTFGLAACGAPDTKVARNTAPALTDGEGYLALTVKTTHGARIFLKDRTTSKTMFLYAPLGEETFAVHKLPQGKYCIDKIQWLEKALNGVTPSMRLNRQHECVEVAAGKLSYGGRWEVSMSLVGEMRVTSTLNLDDLKERLKKHYAELSEQYQVFVPDNTEWTFEFLNRNRT